MNKVAYKKALPFEDGEKGAALAAANFSDDFSDDDEAWLDEELSDEELAALGEDDFSEDELLADELGLDCDGDDFVPDEYDLADELDNDIDNEPLLSSGPTGSLYEDDFQDTEAGGAIVATATRAPERHGRSHMRHDTFEDESIDNCSIPRIAISAFCETNRASAILERAGGDRRLSKAHLSIHMGGIAAAIDHFQGAPTPNLVILESGSAGSSLFAQLGQLAEVCDPSTKVVIIGATNDISLYRELMQQGISEYIVDLRSPLQIIKSIANLYVDPSAPPIGKTIAFVGARGGVGSSTLAHNVAWCSAENFESDTIILDLDLPFGTTSLDFEQDPTSGLVEALASPERLDDVLLDRLLQKHTDRLSLFTAPNLLDRDYDLDDQAFETVIDVVKAAAPTIIIDVPHLWTSWSRRILQSADEIVITAASDLASFRNTKNLVDIIASSRPNDSPPYLVINQFDQKVSSVQPAQYSEHVGVTPYTIINWEPQLFHTAATNASPITEVGGKSKTAQSIIDLSAQLLGRESANSQKTKFDFSGLFKRK